MLNAITLTFLIAFPTPVQSGDIASAIEWAIRLPTLVVEAREVGVTQVAVREVLDGLRTRGLTADEAAMVVHEEVDAVRAGEPKDNFGAFVQQQLDAGLRGRALADAIRGEHQARGIGRGRDEGRGRGNSPPGRDTTTTGGGGT